MWTDEDCERLINIAENLHFSTKEAIIDWYIENPSLKYITENYLEKFIPESTVHTKENMMGFELIMEWVVNGLKTSSFVE